MTLEPVTVNHTKAKITVSGYYNGPVGEFTSPGYLALWRQIDSDTLEANYRQKIEFSDGTIVYNEMTRVYTYNTGKRLIAPMATDLELLSYRFDGKTVTFEALSHCEQLARRTEQSSICDPRVLIGSVLVSVLVGALLAFIALSIYRRGQRGLRSG